MKYFERSAPIADVASALSDDGAVVLPNAIDAALADVITAELRPHFDAEGRSFESDFNGYKTRRLSGILARSRTSADLIAHARLLGIIDQILLPDCINYRIGSTTAIEIEPGEKRPATAHRW